MLDAGKNTLFAYDLATGALLGEYALDPANGDPRGVWSDGVTVWVSDHGAKQLFAYRLPARPPDATSRARATTLEGGVVRADAGERRRARAAGARAATRSSTQPGRVGNNSPRGIWSDGEFMYVADELDGRVYSYNMPDAIDARLASLSLAGVRLRGVLPGPHGVRGRRRRGRHRDHGRGARRRSAGATVADRPARRQPRPRRAPGRDRRTSRHVTVTVTSQDGTRTRVYRVYRVVLGAPDARLASLSLEGVRLRGVLAGPHGIRGRRRRGRHRDHRRGRGDAAPRNGRRRPARRRSRHALVTRSRSRASRR